MYNETLNTLIDFSKSSQEHVRQDYINFIKDFYNIFFLILERLSNNNQIANV